MLRTPVAAVFQSNADRTVVAGLAFVSLALIAASVFIQPLVVPYACLAVLFVAISLFRVHWLFYVVLISIPLSIYLEIGGLPFTSEFLKLPLFLGAVVACLGGRQKFVIRTPITASIVVVSLLVGTSLFRMADASAGRDIVRFLSNLSVFFCSLNIVRTRRRLDIAFMIILFSTAFISIYGIIQYFVLKDLGFLWYMLHPNMMDQNNSVWRDRISSTFTTENEFAAYLNMSMACIYVYFLQPLSQKSKAIKIVAWTTIFLSLIALILTFSRGGWIAFAGTALVIAMIMMKSQRNKTFVLLATVLSSAVIFGGLQLSGLIEVVANRSTIDDYTAITRVGLMKAATLIFFDNPLFGIGYGNFVTLYPSYISLSRSFWADPSVGPHNIYLYILSQIGILGFIPMMQIFVFTGYRGIRAFVSSPANVAGNAKLAIAVAIISSLIHGFVDDTSLFGSHNGFLIFLLLGVFYAFDRYPVEIESTAASATSAITGGVR